MEKGNFRHMCWAAVMSVFFLAGCAGQKELLTVYATRAGNEKPDTRAAYDLVTTYKNPDNVLIIYDASGSMRWPVKPGGEPRYKETYKAFADYVEQISPKSNVGLIVFGSSKPSGIFDGTINDMAKASASCNDDIEVSVPLARFSAAAFQAQVRRLQSIDSYRGDTPIGSAISRATEELGKAAGTRKHIILITDGVEECWKPGGRGVPGSVSPQVAVDNASARGIDVSIISFGIGRNKEGTVLTGKKAALLASLRTLATGVFVEANSGEELFDALLHVEIEHFPFTLFDNRGQKVGSFVLGQPITIAPGVMPNIFGGAQNHWRTRYTVEARGARDFRVDLALPSGRKHVDVFLGLKSRDDLFPDLSPDEYRWKQ